MKAKTVKEVLIATRYIINKLDWCQGASYQTKTGKPIWGHHSINIPNISGCCLKGAISLVEMELENMFEGIEGAKSLIRKEIGQSRISQWNDTPGRTKQQVLDMLDGVIAKLDDKKWEGMEA
jgi:hypothetical protein